jgi:hypothetical protein
MPTGETGRTRIERILRFIRPDQCMKGRNSGILENQEDPAGPPFPDGTGDQE